MAKLQKLTDGNLWTGILTFSLPLIASNVVQVLFNMSDIAVVGRFAGAGALGAVGSSAILIALFTGFLIGIGSGINSLTALFYGAGDRRSVSECVSTSALLSVIIGIGLMIAGEIITRPVLLLLNTKEEFLEGAQIYLKIYFLGIPALSVYNFGNGIWSAVGNTKKPLVFLLIAGVLNVVLNLIFVIVLGLDVIGVAAASAISQYVSAILTVISLFRTDGSFGLKIGKLSMTPNMAKRILALAIPAGCQNAIFGIANLFVQGGVNTFDPVMVEGNSAATNSDSLIYDVMAAFYIACTSFMAQNFGAGKKKRVLKSYLISLFYSFAAGAVLGGLLILFGRQFLGIFTKDPAVIEAGLKRLTIMGFSYAVSALMDCTIAASRGLGKTVVPTFIVIMGSCVFRVAWIFTVFSYFKTIPSLYLLYIFSWSVTGGAEIAYFAVIYKKLTADFTDNEDGSRLRSESTARC